MAPRFLSLLLILVALSASATARPCRTFLISSYSIHNPSSATFATVTEIRSLTPLFIHNNNNNNNDKASFPTEIFFDRAAHRIGGDDHLEIERRRGAPLGFSTYDFSSLRDRTKDILSVVVALLFGVGCGALTAATMYLVWSVFSNRYDYRAVYGDDYSDDDDRDAEIQSPKKIGYVKIPAAEAPAPAKEAV